MKLITIGFLLTSYVPIILTAEVRLVDLEPNDAAQYINRQDQSLRYAPRIETHVPALRFLGNQQQRVLEDIYLANQYHGQDGLGAYIYGYSVPDIAKTEKKERSGDLRGAYEYVAGNGQEIKVQYWDDGTGFHQIDNVPKNLPEDDPDVKAAKEEHLRIWHEQALRNSKAPVDPNQHYFEQQYQEHRPQEVQRYQPQGLVQHNPPSYAGTNQLQHPQVPFGVVSLHPNTLEYAGHGQYSSNQQTYVHAPTSAQSASSSGSAPIDTNARSHSEIAVQTASASQVSTQKTWAPQGVDVQGIQRGQESRNRQISAKHEEEEEEVTGPPKGFFYSFDYPVGIIVGREGQGQQSLSAIYTQNKATHEQLLKAHATA